MSGDIFGCHNGVEGRGCATGIWWVESMDDAKHPSMHRTAPTRENNLTPDVNCTKLRNCSTGYKETSSRLCYLLGTVSTAIRVFDL